MEENKAKRKPFERRIWTKEEALAYMQKVDKSKRVKGLTYWSAYDFINRKR